MISPGRSGILGFGGEPARIEIELVGQAAARASEAADEDDGNVEESDVAVTESPAESSEEPAESSEDKEERPERSARGRGRAPRARGARGTGGRTRGGRGRSGGRRDDAEAAPISSTRDEPGSDQQPGNGRSQESAVAEYEDEKPRERDRPPAERDAEAEQLVAEVLDYFLATMGVVAETYVRDDTEDGSLVFEIEGEDAGLLIGRRGETLQALQFLVRMVVSRQLGRKAYVMIDVEDYRQRRAEMLQRLARRTAGRVASSGRSSALDPMPPGERRIVHMSLASHKRVKTESEGEGNQRRVVILPRG